LNIVSKSGLYRLHFLNFPTELEGFQRRTTRMISYGIERPYKEH